jgi:hypothetical protein
MHYNRVAKVDKKNIRSGIEFKQNVTDDKEPPPPRPMDETRSLVVSAQ